MYTWVSGTVRVVVREILREGVELHTVGGRCPVWDGREANSSSPRHAIEGSLDLLHTLRLFNQGSILDIRVGRAGKHITIRILLVQLLLDLPDQAAAE